MTPSLFSKSGVQLHVGLNTTALLTAINHADEIVLHAAIYSNFANNAVGQGLLQQLQNASLKRLTLIKLEPNTPWCDEFATILRPEMSAQEVEQLYELSHIWCAKLKKQFPQSVSVVSTRTLPLQPILLIGDKLFVGHYAHSHSTSAQGLWLEFDTISLGLSPGTLTHWFYSGIPSELHLPVEIALSRYVEECRHTVGEPWPHPLFDMSKEQNR